MSVNKSFRITVKVSNDDFCFDDLKECIIEGAHNVGNHKVFDIINDKDFIKEIAEEANRVQEVYKKAYTEGYLQGKNDTIILVERKLQE
jgi:hypothetical protein